eukprot:TRINITY_DN11353_c0_g1_i3.p3 TRINITY_DN11353_c0_g1~~TRINITY_DN11353_c0_g1_i3.p3  ORF type:complete len:152 (-),score=27.06 TRINITY_DN11353_c0_g1_i3:406-861(-)
MGWEWRIFTTSEADVDCMLSSLGVDHSTLPVTDARSDLYLVADRPDLATASGSPGCNFSYHHGLKLRDFDYRKGLLSCEPLGSPREQKESGNEVDLCGKFLDVEVKEQLRPVDSEQETWMFTGMRNFKKKLINDIRHGQCRRSRKSWCRRT